ncbi:hypothetical protein OHB24_07005 [Kribbella sp. NBC_00482]|uniref:hypothetical protein n=1 Tax=Kribbella sp. NBC_00482 TaxID=2975968 RepID=UPI002E17ADB2
MTTTSIPPRTPPADRAWSGWRTALVVLGAFLALAGVTLFAVGGVGLWAQHQRDGDGYFTAGPERVSTSTYALSAPGLDIGGVGPDAFYTDDFLGTVRIDAKSTSGTPVFIGIAPAADVAAYLKGVSHDEVADFDVDPFHLTTTARPGDKPAVPPADQSFWVASGTETLNWTARSGDWSVVIMNADGSQKVDAELSVGGTLPAVEGITIGALIGAALLLLIGSAVVVSTITTRRTDRS